MPLCGNHARELDKTNPIDWISDWFADNVPGADELGPLVNKLLNRFSVDEAIRRAVAHARQQQNARPRPRPTYPRRPAPNPFFYEPPPPRPPPPPPPPATPVPPPDLAARILLHFGEAEQLTREKITRRRRKLAQMAHPDFGGDTGAMQQINEAADLLLKMYG